MKRALYNLPIVLDSELGLSIAVYQNSDEDHTEALAASENRAKHLINRAEARGSADERSNALMDLANREYASLVATDRYLGIRLPVIEPDSATRANQFGTNPVG